MSTQGLVYYALAPSLFCFPPSLKLKSVLLLFAIMCPEERWGTACRSSLRYYSGRGFAKKYNQPQRALQGKAQHFVSCSAQKQQSYGNTQTTKAQRVCTNACKKPQEKERTSHNRLLKVKGAPADTCTTLVRRKLKWLYKFRSTFFFFHFFVC